MSTDDDRKTKLRANIAVLCSDTTHKANVAGASRAGATYDFTDAWGKSKTWLKGEYAYLAPNAVSTALNRFNLKHDMVNDAELAADIDAYEVLFLPNARRINAALIDRIQSWLETEGTFLCVTGLTNLPPQLLGAEEISVMAPGGYTAWQWESHTPFADLAKWEKYYISGYQGYSACRVVPASGSEVLAQLLEVTGDLTSIATAQAHPVGPAVLRTDKTLFITNQPFEYLGGMLQAHISNEEVRKWSNVTHWAETLLYQFRWALWQCGLDRLWDTRLRIFGDYDGAMTVRHDNDASNDYAMLDYEAQHLVPATWVLVDSAFSPGDSSLSMEQGWVREISKNEFIEAGLHNDSLQGSPPKWMKGANLYHHVSESQKNLGITIRTCGRHGGYSVYPEMIDAMDYLYHNMPHVLGLGTFCFHFMTEYGQVTPGLQVAGRPVTYATDTAPTIATPGFWFPFHAVMSTTEEVRSLRGWDVTHEYDTAPDLIDQVYRRYNSKDGDPETQLPDGAYQFQYHPIFTRDPDYNDGRGTLDWMCYAIRQAERLNLWLASQEMLYRRMQDYEELTFRVEGEAVYLHNPTDRHIGELMIRRERPIRTARVGEDYLAHIVRDHVCTAPLLEPGAEAQVIFEEGERHHPVILQPNSKGLRFVDVRFRPRDAVLRAHVRIVRDHGLVVTGLTPGQSVRLSIDGTPRRVEAVDAKGRLKLALLGPHGRFADQWIEIHTA